MENMIAEFSSMGVVGIIGAVFLKKYLTESSEDRKVQQEERKEDRELYKKSVENFTSISKEYVESISKLTLRVENVEETTERMEEKIDKIINKVGDDE